MQIFHLIDDSEMSFQFQVYELIHFCFQPRKSNFQNTIKSTKFKLTLEISKKVSYTFLKEI